MAKIIQIEGVGLNVVDGGEILQISVDDPENANQCFISSLDKKDVGEMIKELQRIHAKMTQIQYDK